MNYKNSRNIKLLIGLLLTLLFSANCGVVKSTVREQGPKPFVSADWKNGDAIERARMLGDIYKNRHRLINGKTEAELLEMLGEPDAKKEINGKMVWFYNLESARQTKSKMAITIISGVGQYGLENQRGQMTAPDV